MVAATTIHLPIGTMVAIIIIIQLPRQSIMVLVSVLRPLRIILASALVLAFRRLGTDFKEFTVFY